MVVLPAMYAIMQYIGGALYSKIVPYRALINMVALLLLMLFALFCINTMIYSAVFVFIVYGITSSLLFTPQLSRSMDTNLELRATAAGGFGAGMTLGRILASTISMVCGFMADRGVIQYPSPSVALMGVSIGFIVPTVGMWILRKFHS